MTDLLQLADRCEQAMGPFRELSAEIALAVHDWLHEVEGNKPLNCRVRNKFGSSVYIGGETGRAMDYTASLDAAMTLVPEGWHLSDLSEHWLSGQFEASLAERPTDGQVTAYSNGKTFVVQSEKSTAATPALALCAAALKARAHPNGGICD